MLCDPQKYCPDCGRELPLRKFHQNRRIGKNNRYRFWVSKYCKVHQSIRQGRLNKLKKANNENNIHQLQAEVPHRAVS